MRILVTGGAGFIGSHLVDALVARGDEVFVIDDLSTGRRSQVNKSASFVEADVRDRLTAKLIIEFRPQVVFHEAAQMDVRKSVTDPGFDADVNLVGLVRTLESARKGGELERFLFAGSGGAMYGEQDVFPAPEDHKVEPESPYGLAKAVSEQYLALFSRMYGFPWTSLRYGNVYGPRQDPHGEAGVVAIFCGRLLDGEALRIFGDGEQTRDFVYVGDVVAANLAALEHGLAGGFNVGTGRETTVNEIARGLLAASGGNVPIEHAAERKGEQRRSVIDPAKLHAASGWSASTSLDDGLKETFEYFRARKESA